MVILDTNIIIDHLRQTSRSKSHLQITAEKFPKEELAISIITIQELYEGRSTSDSRKEELMLSTISPLKIIQYDYETSKLAGQVARNLERNMEFADSAIAATCIINNAELHTLNQKDFKGIKDLILYKG